MNVYRRLFRFRWITRYGADVKLEWGKLPKLHVRSWRDVGWLPQPARRCPRLQRAPGAVQERSREHLVLGRRLASSNQQRMLPGDMAQLSSSIFLVSIEYCSMQKKEIKGIATLVSSGVRVLLCKGEVLLPSSHVLHRGHHSSATEKGSCAS